MFKNISLAPVGAAIGNAGAHVENFAAKRIDNAFRTFSRDFFKNVDTVRYANLNTGHAVEITFQKSQSKRRTIQKRLSQ